MGEHLAQELRLHFDRDGLNLCICILGGTKFNCADSQDLVIRIAKGLSQKLRERAVFVTGGMAGVQESFAKNCREGCHLRNLLPQGESSGFGVGQDIHAGKNLDERKAVFGELGDIYITVEGGPGVAQEAAAAVGRGAVVVPLVRTGGASSGMFDFPARALVKPFFMTESQWAALTDKTADIDASADAVIKIVLRYAAAAFAEDTSFVRCACGASIVRSFMGCFKGRASGAQEKSHGREKPQDRE